MKKLFVIITLILTLSGITMPSKSNENKFEIFTTTVDNIRIAMNCYKTGHKEVVIIAHGWFMTKDSRAFSEMAEEFSKYYDVVTMDFRGHGRSGGYYTFTAKETEDLKSVVQQAKKDYQNVYLIGFSLGAASTLIYTAENNDVDKIIVVSPPSAFAKIENNVWKKTAWQPTIKKFEWSRCLSIRPSLRYYERIAPIDIVDKIVVPTMFVAGENDPTVFSWHTKLLFNKALCHKKLYIYPTGTHAEDLFLDDKDDFIQTCAKWFDEGI